MKDKIDDRLRYKGTQLTGPMPNLGAALDNVCMTYAQFFNSQDKVERLKLLGNMRLASIDAAAKAKILIEMFEGQVWEGPLPGINRDLNKRVQYSMRYSQPGLDVGESHYLHGAYLQLTQLGKLFVGINTNLSPLQKSPDQIKQEVTQYLFQIFIVCNDITELCLITNAEPEKRLIEGERNDN